MERTPAARSRDELVIGRRECGREDDERLEIECLPIVTTLTAADSELGPQAPGELEGEGRDLVAEGHGIWLPLRLCAWAQLIRCRAPTDRNALVTRPTEALCLRSDAACAEHAAVHHAEHEKAEQ